MDIQSYEELLLWNYKPPPQLVELGILIENSGLVIFGNPKTFKTVITNQLAVCLATGESWLGFKVKHVRVLYIQAEVPRAEFHKRVMKMCQGRAIPKDRLLFSTTYTTKLDSPNGRKEILTAVGKYKPDVTILDPLQRFITTSDENAMLRLLYVADELKSAYNQTVIIVHHARKPQDTYDAGGAELRGPHIEGWADSIIRVVGNITTDTRKLIFELRNAEQLLPSINVELDRNKLWINKI